ncbi:MAG: hypothetical protein OEZ06_29535 [Myxococcales bacterium]|nr:hypothetical protein [Myxococcales bacterium]
MTSTEDDIFEALLRHAAKTPEVPDRRSRVQPGTRLVGRFEVRHKLGQGGMGQVDDDSTTTLLLIARAMSVYLQGHSGQALPLCHEALARLDLRGDEEGAAYGRMNAERIRIATLFNMGRFDELHRAVPPLLAEFADAGNLYATAAFRTGYGTVAWLARDRLEDADRQAIPPDLARKRDL